MKVYKYRKMWGAFTIFLVIYLLWLRGNLAAKHLDFYGIVQNVDYDIKGEPTITIKGTKYYLGASDWQFGIEPIEVGDKMIKIDGKYDLLLIKKGTKDTINFYKKW